MKRSKFSTKQGRYVKGKDAKVKLSTLTALLGLLLGYAGTSLGATPGIAVQKLSPAGQGAIRGGQAAKPIAAPSSPTSAPPSSAPSPTGGSIAKPIGQAAKAKPGSVGGNRAIGLKSVRAPVSQKPAAQSPSQTPTSGVAPSPTGSGDGVSAPPEGTLGSPNTTPRAEGTANPPPALSGSIEGSAAPGANTNVAGNPPISAADISVPGNQLLGGGNGTSSGTTLAPSNNPVPAAPVVQNPVANDGAADIPSNAPIPAIAAPSANQSNPIQPLVSDNVVNPAVSNTGMDIVVNGGNAAANNNDGRAVADTAVSLTPTTPVPAIATPSAINPSQSQAQVGGNVINPEASPPPDLQSPITNQVGIVNDVSASPAVLAPTNPVPSGGGVTSDPIVVPSQPSGDLNVSTKSADTKSVGSVATKGTTASDTTKSGATTTTPTKGTTTPTKGATSSKDLGKKATTRSGK